MPSILLDVVHRYLNDHGFTVSHARDANGNWGDVTVHDDVHDRRCTYSHEEFMRASKHSPDALLRGLRDSLDLLAGPAVPSTEPPAWDPSHREIL